MSRLATRFAQLKQQGRPALIPYITAGDPEPSVTVPLMHALVEGGADVIELGVPFSDPIADGPVIQQASERALRHHVRLMDVFAMVREFRRRNADTPVVLMGYLNPIMQMGIEEFCKNCQETGIDGVIIPDLPFNDYMANYKPIADKYGVTVRELVSANPQLLKTGDQLTVPVAVAIPLEE